MGQAQVTAPGCLHRALVTGPQDRTEVVVFVEVPWDELVHANVARMVSLLVAAAWNVHPDDLRVASPVRERPLLSMSRGGPQTGDLRLFEVGHWHGPIYAEPERTLLLVGPATLRRLVTAQRSLPIVDATSSMPMPL